MNNDKSVPVVLGSASWGQFYGNHPAARAAELSSLLNLAAARGINLIDTSVLYGGIEQRLAQLARLPNWRFRFISKLADQPSQYPGRATALLALGGRFNRQRPLKGMLIHHFAAFQRYPENFARLQRWRDQGLIEQVGFSLYLPEHLELLWRKKISFNLLQLPYSVIDQRFQPYFEQLGHQGVELHLRSNFLQGKLLQPVTELPPYLGGLRSRLLALREIAGQSGLSIVQLLLAFAFASGQRLVVGMRQQKRLRDLLLCWRHRDQATPWLAQLSQLASTDENLILPYNWHKNF